MGKSKETPAPPIEEKTTERWWMEIPVVHHADPDADEVRFLLDAAKDERAAMFQQDHCANILSVIEDAESAIAALDAIEDLRWHWPHMVRKVGSGCYGATSMRLTHHFRDVAGSLVECVRMKLRKIKLAIPPEEMFDAEDKEAV